MKKLLTVMTAIILLALSASSAFADGFGFDLGGLTSLFRMQSDAQTYEPGETAVVGDYEITMTNLLESKGSQYGKPDKGNVFVIAEFSIKNNSKEDLDISSIMCFSAEADGTTYSLSFTADTVAMFSGMIQFDMSIAPGKTGTGIVGYEVPEKWKELRITVTPDFFSSEKAAFLMKKE
ncbi:MAG: DUF4352 domain-containing protein [Clostridia bacterium]|nr:DUF4352 domain-containing protein [Clostridia bacterium]